MNFDNSVYRELIYNVDDSVDDNCPHCPGPVKPVECTKTVRVKAVRVTEEALRFGVNMDGVTLTNGKLHVEGYGHPAKGSWIVDESSGKLIVLSPEAFVARYKFVDRYIITEN